MAHAITKARCAPQAHASRPASGGLSQSGNRGSRAADPRPDMLLDCLERGERASVRRHGWKAILDRLACEEGMAVRRRTCRGWKTVIPGVKNPLHDLLPYEISFLAGALHTGPVGERLGLSGMSCPEIGSEIGSGSYSWLARLGRAFDRAVVTRRYAVARRIYREINDPRYDADFDRLRGRLVSRRTAGQEEAAP